jgi:hypothetical protein
MAWQDGVKGKPTTHGQVNPMRKSIAIIVLVGLVWVGYTAWPLYDVMVLVRAIEVRNLQTITHYVYFDAVRQSLAHQIADAFKRRTGAQVPPLVQSQAAVALGLVDPVLKKLISPEALSELLAVGWPVTAVSDPPPTGTMGITEASVGTVWDVYKRSDYGIGRFEVSLPSSLLPQQRFRLTFRLLQWRWQLTAVIHPEHIQDLLADELIKARR